MAAMLQHRGPDGHGIYRDARAGLAHTRLSLVDLEGGHQPLTNEDRTLWLVGNGEVFEHAALRRRLQDLGHRFGTGSDLETVLHAYEEWGDGAWAHLDGQFAFALWDTARRHLWLVRDRLGILPLHFAVRPDAVLFASECKALFAAGRLPVAFEPQTLGMSFTLWATPAPHTVFAGVQSVRPGEALHFDDTLRCTARRWWQPDLRRGTPPPTFDRAVDMMQEHLDAAVQRRLRADVPVATYLSGGIDSSVVTALAAQRTDSLHTFAVRFADPRFDETSAQRRVASLLGTQHHEVLCTDDDVRAHLPEVVWHCEAPLLRTAPVPMFLLSDLVRRTGLKAVLTGEGADELLAGYSVFQEDRVRRFWARQPDSTARPALFARVHEFVGTDAQRQGAMWRAFYAQDLRATDDPFHSHRIRWRNSAWTLRLLSPEVQAAAGDAAEAAVAAALPEHFAAFTALGRAEAIEIASFLSPYLLASQGDRVALGHGVEARYPYLDPDVVGFCSGLADARQWRGLRNKLVLRALGARLHLPADVVQRPKQPYRAPTASALLSRGAPDYRDELLSPARLARTGLLDVGAATALVTKVRGNGGRLASEREGMATTGLLTLQLLHEHFVVRFTSRANEALATLRLRSPTVAVDALPTRSPRP
jgi:asparagine synthase (glutamine-hydrolysing)